MADSSSFPPQRPTVIPGVGQFFPGVEDTGEPALSLSNRLTFARASTSGADGSDVLIRRTADYSGGGPWRGFVNSAIAVTTTVSPGTTSFEWAGNFILDNYGTSADGSENVALAWSAIKHSSGRLWPASDKSRMCPDPTPSRPPSSPSSTFMRTGQMPTKIAFSLICRITRHRRAKEGLASQERHRTACV